MLLDEFHQLRLDVGFSWDGHRLLHEGLVEVHFVNLQLQLSGDLELNTQPEEQHENGFIKICLVIHYKEYKPWGQMWRRT